MSLKPTNLLVVVALIWAGPAMAQRHADVHPRYDHGYGTAPQGSLYLGGYSRDSDEGQIIIDFYSRQDRALTNDGIRFGAIPFARRSLDTGEGAPAVLAWADGRTCGALNGVLMEYSRLVAPTFQVPFLYYAPPAGSQALGGPPMRVHPIDSSVWGLARQPDGAPSVLTFTGSDGLIDRWTAFAEVQLGECWRSE
jgi:hypothetical protein